jgi:hypothetical protein
VTRGTVTSWPPVTNPQATAESGRRGLPVQEAHLPRHNVSPEGANGASRKEERRPGPKRGRVPRAR